MPPIRIAISRRANQVTLTWNTQSGAVYHVDAKGTLADSWANVSGTLTANGGSLSWTDNLSAAAQWFYRVVAP